MQNRLLVFLALITFFFSGCVSKHTTLSTNYAVENLKIENNLIAIEIIDNREDVSEREIYLSPISFPGQHDKVSQELTKDQEQMINSQIQSFFTGSGEDIIVKCEILKGYKEFTAHFLSEREYAQFDIKITLLDSENNIISQCTSSAFSEVKALDATYNSINRLYNRALKTSIHKCFEKLQK